VNLPIEGGGWSVVMNRPHPAVTLLEVSLPGYREFFSVTEGCATLAITTIEAGEDAHYEPQVFVFAKPYGWRNDLDGDEALMQVWQAVGVQR
jgi:hypothetical protein